MIIGTPLDCNLCERIPCNYTLADKDSGEYETQVDPKFNANWVKKICTATAIDGFIAYFPFILLVMALVIVLIERVFIRYLEVPSESFKNNLMTDPFQSEIY